jgi:hypothetical protein
MLVQGKFGHYDRGSRRGIGGLQKKARNRIAGGEYVNTVR